MLPIVVATSAAPLVTGGLHRLLGGQGAGHAPGSIWAGLVQPAVRAGWSVMACFGRRGGDKPGPAAGGVPTPPTPRNPSSQAYLLLMVPLNIFYTFAQLDPKDMSDQLRRAGSVVVGVRPGRQTASFLGTRLTRLAALGAWVAPETRSAWAVERVGGRCRLQRSICVYWIVTEPSCARCTGFTCEGEG